MLLIKRTSQCLKLEQILSWRSLNASFIRLLLNYCSSFLVAFYWNLLINNWRKTRASDGDDDVDDEDPPWEYVFVVHALKGFNRNSLKAFLETSLLSSNLVHKILLGNCCIKVELLNFFTSFIGAAWWVNNWIRVEPLMLFTNYYDN